MKTILLLSFLIAPLFVFSQEKIAGQFTAETVTIARDQQIAQQGAGYTITVARSYLTVQGKKYKLYRLSKAQIDGFKRTTQSQQTQEPTIVFSEDFYLLGNQQENGKFVVIQGTIDKETKIIYSATLSEIIDESKISEALNKCGL